MDAPADQLFLLAGSSVSLTDAMAYAFRQRRPCVVFSEDRPDTGHQTPR